jgi:inner membrane protein involved in colicin E2 resistance
MKYSILFIIVTFSTFFIPNCSIMNQHAVYIGLLAATTFVLLDKYYPSIVINKEEHI